MTTTTSAGKAKISTKSNVAIWQKTELMKFRKKITG